jgi:hypothetical protein
VVALCCTNTKIPQVKDADALLLLAVFSCCWCCCSKVVWLLSQMSDFYTTSVTAPLVTHWAQAMAWAVGQSGAAFDLRVGAWVTQDIMEHGNHH